MRQRYATRAARGVRVYRAWIDEWGGFVPEHRRRGDEVRLTDLETGSYRILLRLLWRRRPFYLAVVPFLRRERGFTLLHLGRGLRS